MTTPEVCEQCGGKVAIVATSDRTFEYRRTLRLPVPDDFPIATCERCGEMYMSAADYERLAEAQKPAFLEWQKDHVGRLVKAIRDANQATLREIERACGVTGTYLSHVLAGKTREAGQTLIELLEAFALYPAEFKRQLEGTEPWTVAYERSLRERGPGAILRARVAPFPDRYGYASIASSVAPLTTAMRGSVADDQPMNLTIGGFAPTLQYATETTLPVYGEELTRGVA